MGSSLGRAPEQSEPCSIDDGVVRFQFDAWPPDALFDTFLCSQIPRLQARSLVPQLPCHLLQLIYSFTQPKMQSLAQYNHADAGTPLVERSVTHYGWADMPHKARAGRKILTKIAVTSTSMNVHPEDFVSWFIYGRPGHAQTRLADFQTGHIVIPPQRRWGEHNVALQMWYLPTNIRSFLEESLQFWRGSGSLIVLYDVTDRHSYESLPCSIADGLKHTGYDDTGPCRERLPVTIVGCNIELAEQRQVSTEEGIAMVATLSGEHERCVLRFHEFSALHGVSLKPPTKAVQGSNVNQIVFESVLMAVDPICSCGVFDF